MCCFLPQNLALCDVCPPVCPIFKKQVTALYTGDNSCVVYPSVMCPNLMCSLAFSIYVFWQVYSERLGASPYLLLIK